MEKKTSSWASIIGTLIGTVVVLTLRGAMFMAAFNFIAYNANLPEMNFITAFCTGNFIYYLFRRGK